MNGEYYKPYATYLTRFFEEYAKNGVKFWGMTLQYEPTSGALPFYGWQTMFTDFVRGTLGPMFKKNDATKNLKVIALDDNRMWLNNWPDKACTGSIGVHGPILGDWYRGEEYAEDIITDLNNFVAGWVDWNICLDETSGPTWVDNNLDSPIIVNATADKFYKQPMFYAMGHLRYILGA
ncbi:hypothetical protein OESDEN_04451 [Oesophagostomum dentatum]|uniref:Glucosylceramidase n=1 Tax=Oesophagostomum dentatum TaxID=61180 RepID=A0A0B1TDI6_OESDE|nr:hypothetical protein OESDEN_04451 [Oesophagostomum dentatum]